MRPFMLVSDCVRNVRSGVVGGAGSAVVALSLVLVAPAAAQVDPLAANNGLYPSNAAGVPQQQWSGPYRTASLDYPSSPVPSRWVLGADNVALTVATAPAYMARLKVFLEPTLRNMIERPLEWSPRDNGWYDMVWQGAGAMAGGAIDPTSGREAILSSYPGQVLPPDNWAPAYRPADSVKAVQNHAVIYYDAVSGAMLSRLWRDIYNPDLSAVAFPDGAMVVKVEAVTPTGEEWPVVSGAAEWPVYRPTVDNIVANRSDPAANPLVAEVITVRALQMSIALKDPVAAPETGWVFTAFVYDADAEGASPWDRFVPLGAQWGNDPQFARDPNGLPAGETLTQTWVNPDAPEFTDDTLGWGGRLAGPMDVAKRHEVITTDGTRYTGATGLRASSCLSCHGSAEFPFTTNLYPAPNKSFPPDGDPKNPFMLFTPGSPEWARWFQNRPGYAGMTSMGDARIPGMDYDMVIMFALSAFNAAMGNDGFVFREFDVH